MNLIDEILTEQGSQHIRKRNKKRRCRSRADAKRLDQMIYDPPQGCPLNCEGKQVTPQWLAGAYVKPVVETIRMNRAQNDPLCIIKGKRARVIKGNFPNMPFATVPLTDSAIEKLTVAFRQIGPDGWTDSRKFGLFPGGDRGSEISYPAAFAPAPAEITGKSCFPDIVGDDNVSYLLHVNLSQKMLPQLPSVASSV